MTDKELGAVIAAVRKSSGLTQRDLCERVDVAPHTLCKIEKGTRSLKAVELQVFAQALGVSCEDLFDFRRAIESRINSLRSEIEMLENEL